MGFQNLALAGKTELSQPGVWANQILAQIANLLLLHDSHCGITFVYGGFGEPMLVLYGLRQSPLPFYPSIAVRSPSGTVRQPSGLMSSFRRGIVSSFESSNFGRGLEALSFCAASLLLSSSKL